MEEIRLELANPDVIINGETGEVIMYWDNWHWVFTNTALKNFGYPRLRKALNDSPFWMMMN